MPNIHNGFGLIVSSWYDYKLSDFIRVIFGKTKAIDTEGSNALAGS